MNQAPISTQDINVQITFEAGNACLTLEELQQLAVDQVFVFNGEQTQSITMRANNQVIGSCRLISVNGQLGAQVTSLNNQVASNTQEEAGNE